MYVTQECVSVLCVFRFVNFLLCTLYALLLSALHGWYSLPARCCLCTVRGLACRGVCREGEKSVDTSLSAMAACSFLFRRISRFRPADFMWWWCVVPYQQCFMSFPPDRTNERPARSLRIGHPFSLVVRIF